MRLSVRLVLTVIWLIPFAAGASEFPRVDRYALDVTFLPEQEAMTGAATVWFDPAEPLSPTVAFFLHGELTVDSIFQAGQVLEFEQTPKFYDSEYSLVANRVAVMLSEASPDEPLTVYYAGYFHPSRARCGSDYMRIDPTGVYLRCYGYSLWFPIFLEADAQVYPVTFTEVTLRTPANMTAVFVGHRVEERVESDVRVSIWETEDISLHCAQCTAFPYRRLTEGALTAYHWDDSVSTRAAGSILGFVRSVGREFGERYRSTAEVSEHHVMQMPKYGDISSGNVTGMIYSTWREFDEAKYPKRHLAHELVHPFVRVPIDRADPLYALVIEGFPSYFHLPVLEGLLGKAWYDEYMEGVEQRYLSNKRTGKDRRGRDLPAEKPLDQITPDEVGDYKDYFVLSDRALLFLHYLRYRMGDEAFVSFGRELFNRDGISDESFQTLAGRYLPDIGDDLAVWLSTSDYPERLHYRSLAENR